MDNQILEVLDHPGLQQYDGEIKDYIHNQIDSVETLGIQYNEEESALEFVGDHPKGGSGVNILNAEIYENSIDGIFLFKINGKEYEIFTEEGYFKIYSTELANFLNANKGTLINILYNGVSKNRTEKIWYIGMPSFYEVDKSCTIRYDRGLLEIYQTL